jgi:23S rRNA (adenine2503-C2)-methyltransferase
LNHPPSFFELSFEELNDALQAREEPDYRAHQIWQGFYQQLHNSPLELSTLPKGLRKDLDESFSFQPFRLVTSTTSRDRDTEKALLQLWDGLMIEAVLMRYRRRNTACLSSQVGCAIGCIFCATGQMGFKRNLTAGEIVFQALYFSLQLGLQSQSLSNIVMMGMGEPFLNYEATMRALRILNDPRGFAFGARRMTISTVGIIPMIERFTEEKNGVNLAVSLHAATDELRNRLIPISRRHPLDRLMSACRRYVQRTGRRLTFEWALIQDVNDGLDQASELARLLKGMICHVNLIPLNPIHHYDGLPSSQSAARAFKGYLETHGIAATLRLPRGIDINAGCGQLALQTKNAESNP